MPKMTHPDGKTREVDPQLVEYFLSQGWTKVTASSTTSKPSTK